MHANRPLKMTCTAVLALALAACGDIAKLPFSAGVGPDPQLPPPVNTLIPTVKVAPARGWPDGVTPQTASGTTVTAFASGLDHPRWVYVLPNGDVLVAESTWPAWTPLFATAAAVVTDIGGVLSHCAIVAREYRIPAVVGTGEATKTLHDGQLLEVDGNNGVVRLLNGDNNANSQR